MPHEMGEKRKSNRHSRTPTYMRCGISPAADVHAERQGWTLTTLLYLAELAVITYNRECGCFVFWVFVHSPFGGGKKMSAPDWTTSEPHGDPGWTLGLYYYPLCDNYFRVGMRHGNNRHQVMHEVENNVVGGRGGGLFVTFWIVGGPFVFQVTPTWNSQPHWKANE